MSLLYKPTEEQTLSVTFKTFPNGVIDIDFWSDCGKFGTHEMLSGYKLTPTRLLEILNEYKNYKDEEL